MWQGLERALSVSNSLENWIRGQLLAKEMVKVNLLAVITALLYHSNIVIESFGNTEAKAVFENGKRKKLPTQLLQRAIDLLDIMDNVDSLSDLEVKGHPPSLRLHKLTGSRKGFYAIDINKTSGWRITFKFLDGAFHEVSIENYH
jgi:toxin HigB-1